MAKTNYRDVVANFVRYRGRQPGPDDEKTLQYLTTKDPAEVERLLYSDPKSVTGGKSWTEYQKDQSEGKATEPGGDVNTSNDELTAEQQSGYKELLDRINNMTKPDGTPYSEAEKAVMRQVAQGDYGTGNTTYSPEQLKGIINDAATNAEKDIGTYYDKISREELDDLKYGMENIRKEASAYKESEATNYASTLANTKKSLRQRGLTFSGKSRAVLGEETGLAKGALGVEGSLAEKRRQEYEEFTTGLQTRSNKLGRAGERYLGSDKLPEYGGFYNPYSSGNRYNASGSSSLYREQGGISGNWGLQRAKDIEKDKWERINRYRTNI